MNGSRNSPITGVQLHRPITILQINYCNIQAVYAPITFEKIVMIVININTQHKYCFGVEVHIAKK